MRKRTRDGAADARSAGAVIGQDRKRTRDGAAATI
jgi:hypothetical protein